VSTLTVLWYIYIILGLGIAHVEAKAEFGGSDVPKPTLVFMALWMAVTFFWPAWIIAEWWRQFKQAS